MTVSDRGSGRLAGYSQRRSLSSTASTTCSPFRPSSGRKPLLRVRPCASIQVKVPGWDVPDKLHRIPRPDPFSRSETLAQESLGDGPEPIGAVRVEGVP